MCTERSSTLICHPYRPSLFAVHRGTFQTNTHRMQVLLFLSSALIPQQATPAPREHYNTILHPAAAVAKMQQEFAAAEIDGHRARCQNRWANLDLRYRRRCRLRPGRRRGGGPLAHVDRSRHYESSPQSLGLIAPLYQTGGYLKGLLPGFHRLVGGERSQQQQLRLRLWEPRCRGHRQREEAGAEA